MSIYYILVDINAAYVSFINLFNPHLKNKPVGVLSSNQGNVIARNQELKNLNVKMGDPAYLIQPLVSKNYGFLFGSNFSLFGDMSDRFHCELEELLINPERYSVDEAFGLIDTNCNADVKAYAKHIQSVILKNIGLHVGVGVGRTKTLAKIASWFSKQQSYKHITNGVAVLDTLERENWVLKTIPLIDIWNCGKKTTEKLNLYNIMTGTDLRDSDPKQIRKTLSVKVERTILELRGIDAITLKGVDEKRLQICVSKSMGVYVTDFFLLRAALVHHVNKAALKLRKQGSWCRKLTVFISTNAFKKSDKQYSKSLSIDLPRSTQSTTILTKYAVFVLEHAFIEGFNYKKAGVVLSNFDTAEDSQPDLFQYETEKNNVQVDHALDEINKKFGAGSIQLASEGFDRLWRPKDDLMPPSYTTNILEIPTVK